MSWSDATAAANLLAAMTSEIAIRKPSTPDAACPRPAGRCAAFWASSPGSEVPATVRLGVRMTRLAQHRDTHLTADEIARKALELFDSDPAVPSIRHLAKALNVAPSAIYHPLPDARRDLPGRHRARVANADDEGAELFPDPTAADPKEVLVAVGLVVRRVFDRHYRITPWMAATPESTGPMASRLALLAFLFERLGLDAEDTAPAFHSFATFVLGWIMFSAARRLANEQLDEPLSDFRSDRGPDDPPAGEAAREAVDSVMDLSLTDPQRDEELFAAGLRRMLDSFG